MASGLSLPRALNNPAQIELIEKIKRAMGVDHRIADAMIVARGDMPALRQEDVNYLVRVTVDASLAALLGITGQNPRQISFEIHIEANGSVTVVDGEIAHRLASGDAKEALRARIKSVIRPALGQFFREHKVPRSADLTKLIEKSLSLQFSNILVDRRLQFVEGANIRCVRR